MLTTLHILEWHKLVLIKHEYILKILVLLYISLDILSFLAV